MNANFFNSFSIVRQIRFPDWQFTEGGKREGIKALRRTLAKYKLHTDTELFEKAYGYVKEYYEESSVVNDESKKKYNWLLEIIRENKNKKDKVLFLKSQGIEVIPLEIGELEHLLSLDLRGNSILSIPFTISGLKALSGLDLGFNRLVSLPAEFRRLINLEQLYLNNNRIKEFPQEICMLKKLDVLDLRNNFISNLPPELANLGNLTVLDLRENPLPIPLEILEKTNDPQTILNYYFSLHREGERSLNEVKIIVIGQGAVGKTSVIGQVINNNFDVNESKTEGISINRWQVNNQSKTKNEKKSLLISGILADRKSCTPRISSSSPNAVSIF